VVREPKRWDRIVALAAEIGDALPDTPDNKALGEFLSRRREADPEHFADLSLSVVKLLGPGEYVLERRLGDRRMAGHFGLAVADYVHSTAPNRRFADLVTQRLLRFVARGGSRPYTDDELVTIAARCTERGEAARKVERTMRKIAGASMLADRVGESFAAVITASSPKGTYARLISPPVEGRVVHGGAGLDVGDTVRLTLKVADAVKGYIDFVHETDGAARKLERSRRKKAAADRLRTRIGQMFDAEVTGVSESGTFVRLTDGSAEGRVVGGYKPRTGSALRSTTLIRSPTRTRRTPRTSRPSIPSGSVVSQVAFGVVPDTIALNVSPTRSRSVSDAARFRAVRSCLVASIPARYSKSMKPCTLSVLMSRTATFIPTVSGL
jgi:exoribonuclease R